MENIHVHDSDCQEGVNGTMRNLVSYDKKILVGDIVDVPTWVDDPVKIPKIENDPSHHVTCNNVWVNVPLKSRVQFPIDSDFLNNVLIAMSHFITASGSNKVYIEYSSEYISDSRKDYVYQRYDVNYKLSFYKYDDKCGVKLIEMEVRTTTANTHKLGNIEVKFFDDNPLWFIIGYTNKSIYGYTRINSSCGAHTTYGCANALTCEFEYFEHDKKRITKTGSVRDLTIYGMIFKPIEFTSAIADGIPYAYYAKTLSIYKKINICGLQKIRSISSVNTLIDGTIYVNGKSKNRDSIR
jgi:hypothetical protein